MTKPVKMASITAAKTIARYWPNNDDMCEYNIGRKTFAELIRNGWIEDTGRRFKPDRKEHILYRLTDAGLHAAAYRMLASSIKKR